MVNVTKFKSFFPLLFIIFPFNLFGQINIKLIYWDSKTGEDMRYEIYEKLNNKNDWFSISSLQNKFIISPNCDSIKIKGNGRLITKKTSFQGDFVKKSFANISINELGNFRDGKAQNVLIIPVPETVDPNSTYELYKIIGNEKLLTSDLSMLLNKGQSFTYYLKESDFNINFYFTIISKEGKIMFEEYFNVSNGIFFFDINGEIKKNTTNRDISTPSTKNPIENITVIKKKKYYLINLNLN